jgi:hypothetical protein
MSAVSGGESIAAVFRMTAARFAEREFLHVPSDSCRGYSAEVVSVSYADARVRVDAIAERVRASA